MEGMKQLYQMDHLKNMQGIPSASATVLPYSDGVIKPTLGFSTAGYSTMAHSSFLYMKILDQMWF